MTPPCILAISPAGALAYYFRNHNALTVEATPLDPITLATHLAQMRPDVAAVEGSSPYPAMALAAVKVAGVRLRLVTRSTWRAHFALARTNNAVAVASSLWPARAELFVSVAFAEAALLARFAAEREGVK